MTQLLTLSSTHCYPVSEIVPEIDHVLDAEWVQISTLYCLLEENLVLQ